MPKRNIDLLKEERSKSEKLSAENCKLKMMVDDARKQREAFRRESENAAIGAKQLSSAMDAVLLSVVDQFGTSGEIVLKNVDVSALKYRAVAACKDEHGDYRITVSKRTPDLS